MRPAPHETDNGLRPPHIEIDIDGATSAPNIPPEPTQARRRALDSRLNERLGRLLRQKRGPNAVMLGVLCAALFCGLVGFAVHFLWIVAILVMALGLGFVIADGRRDRIDITNQRSEKADADAV
jgi:hypothetical protein